MALGLSCASDPLRVGPVEDGAVVVSTRQLVHPAGDSVEFFGRPVDIALSPDGRMAYVKDNRGLVAIDTATWTVRQELPFGEKTGGSMHGVAVSADGGHVYATTAQSALYVAAVQADGFLAWEKTIALWGPAGDDPSHNAGIAIDGDTAYVCLSRNNSVAVVDLAEGVLREEIPVGIAPFDIVLAPDGARAYVSNWGGRHPVEGELTAPSSGTEVVVDARGVAASGSVGVLDLVGREMTAQLETGLHPSDIVLSADGATLFVANTNSDSVTIVDTAPFTIAEQIDIKPDEGLPFGSLPNALAYDDATGTLYVANAGNNAVAVVTPGVAEPVRGFIPTGWFPGALALRDGVLYTANTKGNGSRTMRPGDPAWSVYGFQGTVTRTELPDRETLARYTTGVLRDGRVPQALRAWERKRSGVAAVPVPERTGEPSVFEHVVYVIKENRTYDQVFGDLPQGEGAPELCIFPRAITPNHHALAEEFVLLDNYYCNGVNSSDGHSWSTEGIVTDHLEKSFGGFTRSYSFGDDPLTYASSGFIWDSVLLAGLSFRNYGEFDYAETVPKGLEFSAVWEDYATGAGAIGFKQVIGVEKVRRYSAPTYPGWNMNIPDVLRAERFIDELRGYEASGDLPNFTVLYLPQDHTSGTTPGMPTPRAHVGDNDLALGRVVEALSHSRFWPTTCIFVIEDDPQAGFDHIDGHRSICLTISPYTKRGAVVSDFYNQTSVLHTIARILGVPPLNQMDSLAPVMSECFSTRPDFSPYTARDATVPLDELNPEKEALGPGERYWAEKSLAEPFDKFDMADEDTLNRVLWHAMRGVDTPYPSEWAGAHGKGLAKVGLVLTGDDDDD